jgi:hypothetical protein
MKNPPAEKVKVDGRPRWSRDKSIILFVGGPIADQRGSGPRLHLLFPAHQPDFPVPFDQVSQTATGAP